MASRYAAVIGGAKRLPSALWILLWFTCLAPFTILGYGSDNDSWRVARAAAEIWETHSYVRSRTTGFPLFEIGVSPAVALGGWRLSNLLVLLSGAACLAALVKLKNLRELRHPAAVAAGFALLPVFVKNATSTMDYIPALAALLWAYVAVLRGRSLAAGLLVGLSTGLRPASVLFLLPCGWFMYREHGRRAALKMILGGIAWSVVCYSPALLTYGLSTPGALVTVAVRERIVIGGYNALKLFGILQSVLLAGAFLFGFLKARGSGYLRSSHFSFHAIAIGAWLALFAVFPFEAEYLLAAVPSLMLVLDRILGRRGVVVVVAALLSYHVVQLEVLGGESGYRKLDIRAHSGYTVDDVRDRIFKLSTRSAASEYHAPQPTVLFFGEPWIPSTNEKWIYDADRGMYRQRDGRLYVSAAILDEAVIRERREEGFRLIVWKRAKWEFIRLGQRQVPEGIEVIDDLGELFGVPIRGRSLTDR